MKVLRLDVTLALLGGAASLFGERGHIGAQATATATTTRFAHESTVEATRWYGETISAATSSRRSTAGVRWSARLDASCVVRDDVTQVPHLCLERTIETLSVKCDVRIGSSSKTMETEPSRPSGGPWTELEGVRLRLCRDGVGPRLVVDPAWQSNSAFVSSSYCDESSRLQALTHRIVTDGLAARETVEVGDLLAAIEEYGLDWGARVSPGVGSVPSPKTVAATASGATIRLSVDADLADTDSDLVIMRVDPDQSVPVRHQSDECDASVDTLGGRFPGERRTEIEGTVSFSGTIVYSRKETCVIGVDLVVRGSYEHRHEESALGRPVVAFVQDCGVTTRVRVSQD